MTFEVFLNTALSDDADDVTVDYNLVPVVTNLTANPIVAAADLDEDLTKVSGTLTFSADGVAVVHRVDVATFDDGDGNGTDEYDETFNFVLSNQSPGVTLAVPSGTGTIYDNDLPPSLSVNDAKAYEGSTVNFTVNLSARSEKVVRVVYTVSTGDHDSDTATPSRGTASTTDNEDLIDVDASATLTFSPASGQTLTQVVPVATVNDTQDEEDEETFTLTLTASTESDVPLNATLEDATAEGTILDNDPLPSLSIAHTSGLTNGRAPEDGNTTPLVFTVTMTGPTNRDVTVDYTVATDPDDTATNADFTGALSGTLTLNTADATGTLTVTIFDDSIGEPDETATVMLKNPDHALLGSDSVTFTINADNDAVVLSVDDAEAFEDESMVFTVTMSAVRAQDVMVNYATSIEADDNAEEEDFTAADGVLTIEAEDISGTVTVTITNDDVDEEENETFTLTLSGPRRLELPPPVAKRQRLTPRRRPRKARLKTMTARRCLVWPTRALKRVRMWSSR